MKRRDCISKLGLPLVVAALVLNACGGASPAPPVVAHGTPDLSQALPAPTPTPYPAFGARQPGSRGDAAKDAQAAIAPYLRAQRSSVVPTPVGSLAAEPARRRQAVSASSVPAATAVPRVASGAAEADDARIASKSESLASDAHRYAERQSRTAEAYRGGDAIVIGAGTLLLVLLIVLLVVLLT